MSTYTKPVGGLKVGDVVSLIEVPGGSIPIDPPSAVTSIEFVDVGAEGNDEAFYRIAFENGMSSGVQTNGVATVVAPDLPSLILVPTTDIRVGDRMVGPAVSSVKVVVTLEDGSQREYGLSDTEQVVRNA